MKVCGFSLAKSLLIVINNFSFRFRRKSDQHLSAEETMFNFWIEYFDDATKDDVGDNIMFPILIWEPTKVGLYRISGLLISGC